MLPDLGISLQITLLGMGLVFAAIILITLMMAALVRLTSQKEKENIRPAVMLPDEEKEADGLTEDRKRRAAAAAVACALTLELRETLPNPIRATRPRPISPWQSAHRSGQIKERGR